MDKKLIELTPSGYNKNNIDPQSLDVCSKGNYTDRIKEFAGKAAVEVIFGEVTRWDSGGDFGWYLSEILPKETWDKVLEGFYSCYVENDQMVILDENNQEVKCGYYRYFKN